MAQVDNKAVSKNSIPDIFAKPMDNPFPEDGVDRIAARSAGDGEFIMLDDTVDVRRSTRLPGWFDPANFLLTIGLGYGSSSIRHQTKWSVAHSESHDSWEDEYYWGNESSSLTEFSRISASGNNLMPNIGLTYAPFVSSNNSSAGLNVGYQYAAAINGHGIGVGLGGSLAMFKGLYARASFGYSHLWSSGVKGTNSVKSNYFSYTASKIPGDDYERVISHHYDDEDAVSTDLNLHGLYVDIAFDYMFTDLFGLGVYYNATHYGERFNNSKYFISRAVAYSGGLRVVTDF